METTIVKIEMEAPVAKELLLILEDYIMRIKEGIEEAHMGEERGIELTYHYNYAEYISHLERQKNGAKHILKGIQEQTNIKVLSDGELAKL